MFCISNDIDYIIKIDLLIILMCLSKTNLYKRNYLRVKFNNFL